MIATMYCNDYDDDEEHIRCVDLSPEVFYCFKKDKSDQVNELIYLPRFFIVSRKIKVNMWLNALKVG